MKDIREITQSLYIEKLPDNPRTFTDKLRWKMKHDRRPILTTTADKYEVIRYLEKKGFGDLLKKLYFVTDAPEEIPFDDLPDRYVVKSNHRSGDVIIIDNGMDIVSGAPLGREEIISRCNDFLAGRHCNELNEWAYRNIKPVILVEEFLSDENGLPHVDYKFLCFGGKAKIVEVIEDRFGAFTATILFLAVQVFVLRGSYILFERFPNPLVEWLVALITGAVSVLAGISGTLIGSVLKAFSYPWESTFAAAAAGIMVSLIGTGGFMINGPAFSEATPLAVGYVDIAAAVSALAGMFLASPIGRWLNVHHRLHTFKKHIAADRFIEPFSGLCSRQYFDAMLDYSVANSSRLSEPLSLMIIDIDDLSMITKKHGQKLANHILASMSETLRESIREPDLVSRYGGDEFYVILLGASKEASIAASNRIMTRFKGENINIESDGEKMPVSFSIGVSTYSMVTPAMIDKVSLVEQAKRAMHESKRNGKNRITHYECMPG